MNSSFAKWTPGPGLPPLLLEILTDQKARTFLWNFTTVPRPRSLVFPSDIWKMVVPAGRVEPPAMMTQLVSRNLPELAAN